MRSVSQRSCTSWLGPLWTLPTSLVFGTLFTYLLLFNDHESDLWFAPLAGVFVPIGLVACIILGVVSSFRTLQAFGALGVVYIRPFDDGSALVGSWWRVRKGHGLVVDQDSKIRLKVSEGNEKILGWTRKTGIPVYMIWNITGAGAHFSWRTPFIATPDATKRINTALKQLSEPTHESLDTSLASQAAQ